MRESYHGGFVVMRYGCELCPFTHEQADEVTNHLIKAHGYPRMDAELCTVPSTEIGFGQLISKAPNSVFVLIGSDDYVPKQILDIFETRELAEEVIEHDKAQPTIHTMYYRLICRDGEPRYEILEKSVVKRLPNTPEGI
jgi:hypothetical protein